MLNAFTVRNVPRYEGTGLVRDACPVGISGLATASARFPRNCITAPASQTADLVLTKTIADARLTAGQRATYRIHVLNRGPTLRSASGLPTPSTPGSTCSPLHVARPLHDSGQRVTCRLRRCRQAPSSRRGGCRAGVEEGTIPNVARRALGTRSDAGNNVDSRRRVTGRAGGVSPASRADVGAIAALIAGLRWHPPATGVPLSGVDNVSRWGLCHATVVVRDTRRDRSASGRCAGAPSHRKARPTSSLHWRRNVTPTSGSGSCSAVRLPERTQRLGPAGFTRRPAPGPHAPRCQPSEPARGAPAGRAARLQHSIGVGRPRWPTPAVSSTFGYGSSTTAIRSTARSRSGRRRSPWLTDWPKGGVVGIHGTDAPQLLPAASPTAASGCERGDPPARTADAARHACLDTVTGCGGNSLRAAWSSGSCAGGLSWPRSARRENRQGPGRSPRA